MASSPSRIMLLALAILLAVVTPSVDSWGGRLFFSKMTRPEAAVEADKAADTTTAGTTEAFEADSAPAFSSRPSSNRGYGLYGRPEENEKYPPAYFRRGVHHDAEKRTTTNVVVPAAREEATAMEADESSSGEKEEPVFPENGSGRGRPLSYMRPRGGGRHEGHGDYGMSDTRLYQNGRYYYDVETDKYGYGHESNPVRTRPEPEVDNGSGYGGDRRSERYGSDDGGAAEKQNNDDGFQESQNEQYNP